MGALDQPRAVRRPGESYAAFRERSRLDYKFDPGIGSDSTDFTAALTPRMAGAVAQTGSQTHSWDAQQQTIADTGTALRNLRNPGSLSSAVAAMPVMPPKSLFDSVSDQGIPGSLGDMGLTNIFQPQSSQFGITSQFGNSDTGATASTPTTPPAARFGMESFNVNGGDLRVLNTPYGNGTSFGLLKNQQRKFTSLGRVRPPKTYAQAGGLPF